MLKSGTDFIWSNTANTYITINGKHNAILFDGRVYDNIHTTGVTLEQWLADFICAISAQLDKIPF